MSFLEYYVYKKQTFDLSEQIKFLRIIAAFLPKVSTEIEKNLDAFAKLRVMERVAYILDAVLNQSH